jgi:hypothetical protein
VNGGPSFSTCTMAPVKLTQNTSFNYCLRLGDKAWLK